MGLARALSWKLPSWPPAPGERAAVSLGHPANKPTCAWGSGLTFPLPALCVGHSRQLGPYLELDEWALGGGEES